MFQVHIDRNGKEKVYFVYNANELVETKALLNTYSMFALDLEKYDVDMQIVSTGDHLSVILKHLQPVMIAEDRILEAINNSEVDFLPFTPITEEEYYTLLEYAIDHGEFLKEKQEKLEIDKDINFAKQYVKKKQIN